MTANRSFDVIGRNRRVRLLELLGRGGEGEVFSTDSPNREVAKVYTRTPEPGRLRKLSRMAELANPRITDVAAWPVGLIGNSASDVRGFLMPRIVSHRDVHELYSPKSRFDAFPSANFPFLVHVATNIARAFAVVHAEGHVIGDVNQGNVLVGADGKVVLIDCDSFQIGGANTPFTCDVGVPLFTPPELHGKNFRGLQRTAQHDSFGLAVLVFHLLFQGRHPFAGRYRGSGEMTIERAIAENRFAYASDTRSTQMERPPGTVPLDTMGSALARMFVDAFRPSTGGAGRPSPTAWISALAELQKSLKECSRAAWHHFPSQLSTCPWCTVESETGARLFGQRPVAAPQTGPVDLATLWSAIERAPIPPPEFPPRQRT